MELKVKCPSCQNTEKLESLEKVKNYSIVHCLNCDLFFTNPTISPSRNWYEKVLVDKTAMVIPEVWLKWQKKIHNKFFKKDGNGKMLLDAGCGDGEFIKKAQEKGYKVTGVDLNRILISKIKEKYNLEVYAIRFEEFVSKFPHRTFDVITLFEVLEHTSNLGKFFSLIKSKLKPGGFIALSVPNRNRFRLGHKRFPEWDSPPHHLTWWNTGSLKRFLTLMGFKILEFKEFKRVLKSKNEQKEVKVNGPYLYAFAQKTEI